MYLLNLRFCKLMTAPILEVDAPAVIAPAPSNEPVASDTVSKICQNYDALDCK